MLPVEDLVFAWELSLETVLNLMEWIVTKNAKTMSTVNGLPMIKAAQNVCSTSVVQK